MLLSCECSFYRSPTARIKALIDEGSFGSKKVGSNLEDILNNEASLKAEFEDMDVKLTRVLRKHEYDYMQAYNIYVKRKENELKGMIS